MSVKTVRPSKIFPGFPQNIAAWENTWPSVAELLQEVRRFTDNISKGHAAQAFNRLNDLHACLSRAHVSLAVGHNLNPEPYAPWLARNHIAPTIQTLGNYNRHAERVSPPSSKRQPEARLPAVDEQATDPRESEPQQSYQPSTMLFVIESWGSLCGAVTQLQYVLENQPAPYLATDIKPGRT